MLGEEAGGEPPPDGTSPGQRSRRNSALPANYRPETSGTLLSPFDISTNPWVVGINLLLAIILLLTLMTTSQLFNDALDENREEIESFLGRLLAPLRGLFGAIRSAWLGLPGTEQVIARLAAPLAVLALIALIYTLNEPGAGLNKKTLVLVLSLIVGMGLITYVYEGGQALFARRRLQIPAAVLPFPFALIFALATLGLSRVVNFHPTIIYGFVAGAVLLAPARLDPRQAGQAIFFPALALLGVALGAWFLVTPLRDLANESSDWWAFLPGETAALLFVTGIEGLLFAMIPLRFADGSKVFAWNRLLWLAMFAIPVILFSWVLLNPEAKEFDVLLEGRVILALCVVFSYALLGVATWSFFHFRHRRAAGPA